MKMHTLFIFLFGLLSACGQQNGNDPNMAEIQKEYDRHKQYFDVSEIAHFPKILQSKPSSIGSYLNFENNNVGFLLSFFEVNDELFNSVIRDIEKMNVADKYQSNDNNLLYVIPKSDEFINSRQLDRNIDYSNKLPVADLNFYYYEDNTTIEYLNNDFDIYVLEAKAGKLPQYPNLRPNMNMPEDWRNGFSRGISISKKGKVVVYWTVIW